ncbi:hypothetical protein ACWDDN_01565 [Streptomyces griseoruber]|uniref:hypothetical protein n=1 Tax=Streptomyces sp. DSM 15324 TaxID=1739111 RepID=UPI00074AF163|nr:hypothetical protein [Streptomyces sp. DSM 15324]KUO14113.1 hypothetical protein AQJ58_03450 [Streptomyces sp. DSM 15324]
MNLLTATVITVGAVMTVGSGTASAAVPENVRFYDSGKMSDGSRFVEVFVNGTYSGIGYWHADGDTLEAVDPHPDGFGIAAYLSTSPVREASTYGHSSPYTAKTGGNLTEDKSYKFWVCIGGNAGQKCSDQYSVTS